MQLQVFDYSLIFLFLLFLIYIIVKGFIEQKSGKAYFNAGGKMSWIVIGASLLGTNISFEYIFSSASNGFSMSLAFGSYEWMASFVMILVALYIIPYFIRIGVLTLPEYLEYRFNRTSRVLMGILFLMLQVGMMVPLLISNAMFMEKLFDIPRLITISGIAVTGGLIIYSGGMSAKLRLDKVVISLFFLAASLVLVLCFIKTDGLVSFVQNADGRLAVVMPADHEVVPWTSVFLGGLWVLHLKYWAFLQPISQTALASDSLSETQKGFLLAATAKLFTPFLMIIPGIVAYELYKGEVTTPDMALPVLLKHVVPLGLGGLILVGYLGTMFTTYTGFLNATVVVFSLDIFQHLLPEAIRKEKLATITRFSVMGFVVLSIIMAYNYNPEGTLFKLTQVMFLSVAPISCSVFLFAIFTRRTRSIAAVFSCIAGLPLFFLLKEMLTISLLNLSGIVFLILMGVMLLIRLLLPLPAPVVLPEKLKVKFERNLAVVIWSIFILTCVAAIYAILI